MHALGDAPREHDNAVSQCLASVLKQNQADGQADYVPFLQRSSEDMTESFRESVDWMRLSKAMNIREWQAYKDAAHVAMWSQSYNSAQVSLSEDVTVCAYPALGKVIMQASRLAKQPEPMTGYQVRDMMAVDLAEAWSRHEALTLAMFPHPEQRSTPSAPGYWVTLGDNDVVNVGRLPEKAQRLLSKPVHVSQTKVVEAGLRSAVAVDSAERLQLYEGAGNGWNAVWRAQPWMDDGDLHIGNSDYLVPTALRFALDLHNGSVPRRNCPCGWRGPEGASGAGMQAARRAWARHALVCTKGAGKRTHVHDQLSELVMAMLRNAGYRDVQLEDQWWDAMASYGDEDKRRPDITCVHPVTGHHMVFDLVVWWRDSLGVLGGTGPARGAGRAATKREEWKRRRYARAMRARYMEGLSPAEAARRAAQEDDDDTLTREVDLSLMPVTHEFIPLGFEGGGAFGAATLNFLQQVQDTAGGMTPADLYHWSAPEWGEHWRQRIGAVLARGQAELVGHAVASARNVSNQISRGKASSEWSETLCRPCHSMGLD